MDVFSRIGLSGSSRSKVDLIGLRGVFKKNGRKENQGFTLVELLVVIAIIAILAGLLLPALSNAKASAQRIKCLSQVKQLALSSQLYRDDWKGNFPARADGISDQNGIVPTSWPGSLFQHFQSTNMLRCPSDRKNNLAGEQINVADKVSRSYIMNGWNDFYLARMKRDYNLAALSGLSFNESSINQPSDTVVFGEKKDNSLALYMDFLEGFGNDIREVEHGRHSSSSTPENGSSVYAMADGSARPMKFGGSFQPINMWATESIWRTNTAIFVIE
jgi:prepilin-type N-terminal cleavage/methylation domain-containing protein